MSEIGVEHAPFNFPQTSNRERLPLRRKIGNVGRRFAKIFRKSESKREIQLPTQAVDEYKLYEEMMKINPERAKRVYREGCAMRSIMSAATHATGEKNVRATDDEWKVWFEHFDAYNERLKRGDVGELQELYQHLKDVYEGFALNDTPLGRAIDKVDINIGMWETPEKIKDRIRRNEQVLIHVDTYDKLKSHIYHAGLDENGNIIRLSDQKRRIPGFKPRYRKAKLTEPEYNILTVTPRNT